MYKAQINCFVGWLFAQDWSRCLLRDSLSLILNHSSFLNHLFYFGQTFADRVEPNQLL